jgi:hypothetical protein
MIFISHRGNLSGPDKDKENKPSYIDNALKNGYDVEIDLRLFNDELFLGHDSPQYFVTLSWLLNRKSKLWIHCKDVESMLKIKNCNLNYFWHENDKLTLTNKGFIWAYPSEEKIEDSIDVLPETYPMENYSLKINGICSDHIEKYKNLYKSCL